MSAGVFHTYGQVFGQVVAERGRRNSLLTMTTIFLACAVVLYWLLAHVSHNPYTLRYLLVFLFCVAVALWCGTFLGSAVRQNSPVYASLVPHLHRRLLVSCALACGLSIVVTAVAATLAMGTDTFAFALLSAGAVFGYLLFVQRYKMLWLLPSVLIFGTQGLVAMFGALALPPPAAFAAPGWIIAAVTADVVLVTLGLRAALPAAGDRHFAWHRNLSNTPAAKRESGAATPRDWLRGPGVGYFSALRRDSVRGAGAPPDAMMLHVLGPSVHIGGALMTALVPVALVLLLVAVRQSGVALSDQWLSNRWWQLLVLMAAPGYAWSVLQALGARGGEQSLYLMSASAPARLQFNRVFGRILMHRFLLIWAVSAVSVYVLGWIATGAPDRSGAHAMMAVVALLFAPMLWRDYARSAGAGGWRPVVGMVTLVLAGVGVLGALSSGVLPTLGVAGERRMPTRSLPQTAITASVTSRVRRVRWRWSLGYRTRYLR